MALVCLTIGLFTPILEIAAFERDLSIPVKVKTEFLSLDIDYTAKFEGEMYFYYQSKSIVELIGLLLRQGNWVVGISILVFSLLFPLGKTLFTLLALQASDAWVRDLKIRTLHNHLSTRTFFKLLMYFRI